MREQPIRLQLEEELREEVERELIRCCCNAVDGAATRDSFLQAWRDMMEGLGETSSNQRWQNACSLYSPLVMTNAVTLISQMSQAFQRDPKVAVEAFDPEDADNAKLMEEYLSAEGNKVSIDGVFYKAIHNAVRDPFAIIYTGWKWESRKRRGVMYKSPGSSALYTDEERDEEEQSEEVPVIETEETEGYDLRVVDAADFYLYPSNAQCIEAAEGVWERQYLTRTQLLQGVKNKQYDREAVLALLRTTSGIDNEYKKTQDAQDGVENNDGLYEVFVGYTRLPYLLDEEGDFKIPDYLQDDCFLAVISKEHQICLSLDFSPFPENPFTAVYILEKPGRLMGYCVPSLLEAFQGQATASLRQMVDSMDITTTPTVKVKKGSAADENKYQTFPGAVIAVDGMDDIEPMVWPQPALNEGIAFQSYVANEAQALISAEGQGELQPKVRKAAEIQAVQQQASSKFGLFLWNFQRTGPAEVFRKMISLKLHFENIGEGGEYFLGLNGQKQHITAEALKGRYRFVPSATSLTASPEARAAVAQASYNIATQYLTAASQLPPNLLPYLWHGAREVLFDLGIRNPEAWIGPEPQGQPEVASPQLAQQFGNYGSAAAPLLAGNGVSANGAGYANG